MLTLHIISFYRKEYTTADMQLSLPTPISASVQPLYNLLFYIVKENLLVFIYRITGDQ
jgi:hypothetical protein